MFWAEREIQAKSWKSKSPHPAQGTGVAMLVNTAGRGWGWGVEARREERTGSELEGPYRCLSH